MRSSRVFALDIGAAHVAGAVFRAGAARRLELEDVSIEFLNHDPAVDARWLPEALNVVQRVVNDWRGRGEARLAIPGHLALTKFVRTPAIESSKRAAVVRFEATQNIPYPLSDVAWNHLVVSEGAGSLDLLLMAVKRDVMQSLCDAATRAGQPPGGAMPSCVALCRAFRYNYPESVAGALLVDVGARSTHVLLVERTRFLVRTLPLAANSVTQAIAEELGLGFAEAEILKIGALSEGESAIVPPAARAAVDRAAGQFAARLQSEVVRTLASFRRQDAGSTVAALYLTGGGAMIATLPDTLGSKLGVPAERYDPLRRVDVKLPATAAVKASAVLATAVGLATDLVDRSAPVPTLLPETLQDAAALRRRRPVLVTATLCLLLALTAPGWRYHRTATNAKAERASIESQLKPLRAAAQQNAAKAEQLAQLRREIATLLALTAARTSWLRFFSDLQDRLGQIEDVWLDRVSVIGSHSAGQPYPTQDDGTVAELKLRVGGCLLDTRPALAKASPESYQHAKWLLESLAKSRFVGAVEDERFDSRQPGLLRFDFTLRANPENPL